MAQTIFAGEHFDESAEFFDANDAPFVKLVHFDLGGHSFNGLTRDVHTFFGRGVDIYGAIVLDVHFATGFLDDALDILPTRPDQRADLLGIDLNGHDARR